VAQNNGWETLIGWNSTINCWNSEGNKSLTIDVEYGKGYVNFVFCFCFVLFFCRLCSTNAYHWFGVWLLLICVLLDKYELLMQLVLEDAHHENWRLAIYLGLRQMWRGNDARWS
jgi:hypothetical protein